MRTPRTQSRPRSGTGRRHPFAGYFRNWLATYARHHCKPGTVAGYEAAGRLYLIPAFGRRDLRTITRADVKQLVYETLLPGRARATVRANLAPLRELFNHAIEDGIVASNPAAHVLKRMRGEKARAARAPRFLTSAELCTLLATCRVQAPRWYPFVLTLARTGLRLGEALALRWDDVDLAAGIAVVRHAFWRGRLQAPKSGTGRRVDLSRQLVATLEAIRADQRSAALWDGVVPSPWVFASAAGRPPDSDAFRRGPWRRLFVAAGIPYAWPHCLRHTYASLLIQNGESLAYVKAQLGHRSIQTTVDVYGHLVSGANRAAVDRLDD
jgi:integrase